MGCATSTIAPETSIVRDLDDSLIDMLRPTNAFRDLDDSLTVMLRKSERRGGPMRYRPQLPHPLLDENKDDDNAYGPATRKAFDATDCNNIDNTANSKDHGSDEGTSSSRNSSIQCQQPLIIITEE